MLCGLILAGCTAEKQEENLWDMPPAVMIDGTLYLTTGHTTTYVSTEVGEDFWDGTITSEVPGSELPTQNDQSNFGTGFGYRYGEQEGTVELELNRNWVIFATKEVRAEIQFPVPS